jgi:hypothetical protein
LTAPGSDPEEGFEILLGDYQAIKKYVRLQEEGIEEDEEETGRPKGKDKTGFYLVCRKKLRPARSGVAPGLGLAHAGAGDSLGL